MACRMRGAMEKKEKPPRGKGKLVPRSRWGKEKKRVPKVVAPGERKVREGMREKGKI